MGKIGWVLAVGGLAAAGVLAGYGFYLTISKPASLGPAVGPPSEKREARAMSKINPDGSAASKYRKIAEFRGRGTKNTETFHVPEQAREWNITWHTEPPKGGVGYFGAFLHRSDDRQPPQLIANITGKDRDTSVIRGTGDYYLAIIATQPYGIVVWAAY